MNLTKSAIRVGILCLYCWYPCGYTRAADFRPLGVLIEGGASRGEAISSDGTTVVGYATSGTYGLGRSFRWTQGSGMRENPLPEDGVYSDAIAASSDGYWVVGGATLETVKSKPYVWGRNGEVFSIGPFPEEQRTLATGISADGAIVVGVANHTSAISYAFRWSRHNGVQRLGLLPGGSYSYATGISADGRVIVGHANNAAGLKRAFRWTDQEGMHEIEVRNDSAISEAVAVSADGAVIVGTIRKGVDFMAFRWTMEGGIQRLGTLQGKTSSLATAVSGDGSRVAGTTLGPSRIWIWSESGGMQDLNAYIPGKGLSLQGWVLESAKGLNSDGSIVTGGAYFKNELQAYIISLGVTNPVAPALLVEPRSRYLRGGEKATLAVVATGSPPPHYQWYLDGQIVSGATQSTLIITNNSSPKARAYTVLVSNSAGSVRSSAALVSNEISTSAPPVVNPPRVFEGNILIDLTTPPLVPVVVEYADRLDGVWLALTNVQISASSGSLKIFDPVTNSSSRFYRALTRPNPE